MCIRDRYQRRVRDNTMYHARRRLLVNGAGVFSRLLRRRYSSSGSMQENLAHHHNSELKQSKIWLIGSAIAFAFTGYITFAVLLEDEPEAPHHDRIGNRKLEKDFPWGDGSVPMFGFGGHGSHGEHDEEH
eukprot:TRINITY_DN14657_c0_g1_i1.p1 TRINITY_DN14657_c0_g1~~TRINITY_DN14657_c0_g1_i1.p1  ORF type:complete len:130 (+),score=11.87 TRINITY_DN14657_c0_g1_i1:42-431(+)